MDLSHIFALALLQGLTEFLPISSSAHLILLPGVLDWSDQGLAFDVAVHVGTLVAVIAYFRRDLTAMAVDWGRSVARGGAAVGDSKLAWAVLFGTIPVGLAGAVINEYAESLLRSPMVIIVTTAGFGLLLWWGDKFGSQERDEHTLGWRDVLIIGVAQALALIPGTSRSGITITAGLALGLTRSGAARFSFLLAVPVIALAGGLKGWEAWTARVPADWSTLGLGATLAAVSAYLCIHFFLKLLERVGLFPFVVYRLALAVVLVIYFYG